MIAALALALMAGAALGWGGLVLRAAGLNGRLAGGEHWAWAFALGIGLVGAIGFYPAWAGQGNTVGYGLVLAAGLPGLALLPRRWRAMDRPGPLSLLLLAGLALTAAGDLVEALAPPVDADSLAYHFAIPREMVRAAGLVFVPRAVDGAIPLLQQTTYAMALAVGGERAMTLWTGLTGWSAVWLLFVLARRFVSRDWALALALLTATTPAVLYGAGSGQVEVRLAAFTLVALAALAESRLRGEPGWALVAGIAAGLAVGSKYTGLFLALLGGVMLLSGRRGISRAALFSAAVLVVGWNWYWWNWAHTGDPFFPMLWGKLPYDPAVGWNEAMQQAFKTWTAKVETPLPRSPLEFLVYPWRATFFPLDGLESGRTGLGLWPLLALPFAVAAGWVRRGSDAARWLGPVALLVFGYYALWFGFGASQRVRHYVPFLPAAILVVGVAAARAGSLWPNCRRPLTVSMAVVLAMQLAAQGVFVRLPLSHLVSGESRDAYLDRVVGWMVGARWINANLDPARDKVLVNMRQWLYVLDVPAQFVQPNQVGLIETRSDLGDPRSFYRQMRAVGITKIVVSVIPEEMLSSPDGGGLAEQLGQTAKAGCVTLDQVLQGPPPMMSRSLAAAIGAPATVAVLSLQPQHCPFESQR